MKKILLILLSLALSPMAFAANVPYFTGQSGNNPLVFPTNMQDMNVLVGNINTSIASADFSPGISYNFTAAQIFSGGINSTTTPGYQINGGNGLTITNGNFPFLGAPTCVGNCDTFVGALAGGNITSPLDHLSTLVGFNAGGAMNSTNTESTAVGWNAAGNITGSSTLYFITAMGVNSLGLCTTGCISDVVIGTDTALHSMTLTQSVVIGQQALNLGNGTNLVALGYDAMQWNATATGLTKSIAIGAFSLGGSLATTATNNIAIGDSALINVTTANNNVAIGINALAGNASGTSTLDTVAIGNQAMIVTTTAQRDVAIGALAGNQLTTGADEVFIGWKAGQNTTTGVGNVCIGSGDCAGVTGGNNTVVGSGSGIAITGNTNTIVGRNGGAAITSASNNLILGGNNTGSVLTTGAGNILIASGAQAVNVAASSTTGTINVENVWKATGTATPSTSVTTVAGTLAVAGSSLTVGGTSVLPTLSGTTSAIGGSPLLAGACAAGTVTVTGATSSMVATTSPAADPDSVLSTGIAIYAFVSSADTVTVRVCAIVAVTPAAVAYNVRIIQ